MRAGETTELDPFDLGTITRALDFEVLDESGAPVPGVTLRGGDGRSGSDVDHRAEARAGGVHRLRAIELPLPLLRIAAPGFRTVTLENVERGQRILLRRGPLVRVILGDSLPVDASWSIWARFSCEGEEEAAARFDAAGQATARLSRPGRFHVSIAFRRPDRRGFSGVDGLGWWLEVADSVEEQTFTTPALTPEVSAELQQRFSR